MVSEKWLDQFPLVGLGVKVNKTLAYLANGVNVVVGASVGVSEAVVSASVGVLEAVGDAIGVQAGTVRFGIDVDVGGIIGVGVPTPANCGQVG